MHRALHRTAVALVAASIVATSAADAEEVDTRVTDRLQVQELSDGVCLVRSPEFRGAGNTTDADLARWPEAVLRVRARYNDTALVVPGHGTVGDLSLLTHTVDLFPLPR